MTIVVQSPGMFTTVQDLGRPGYGPIGVSASGAADPLSLRLGNRLVGNPETAAALELTLLGGTFIFPEGAVVAVTGGDFGASVPWGSAVEIEPGQAVRLGPSRSGARAYLCVSGGIDVPVFLASRSTHILSGLGGFEGRALRKGDLLKTGRPATSPPKLRLNPSRAAALLDRKRIRVTAGPQAGEFNPAALGNFFSTTWSVSEQSNRMGIRLTGPALDTPHGGQMITEGVALGAVQVPAGGQPIILFVEQQTTGGYPKIANVIAADLAALGQLRPRDRIGFEMVTIEEARRLLIEQERSIAGGELFD